MLHPFLGESLISINLNSEVEGAQFKFRIGHFDLFWLSPFLYFFLHLSAPYIPQLLHTGLDLQKGLRFCRCYACFDLLRPTAVSGLLHVAVPFEKSSLGILFRVLGGALDANNHADH